MCQSLLTKLLTCVIGMEYGYGNVIDTRWFCAKFLAQNLCVSNTFSYQYLFPKTHTFILDLLCFDCQYSILLPFVVIIRPTILLSNALESSEAHGVKFG